MDRETLIKETLEANKEKIKGFKSVSDAINFAKELVGPTIQAMMESEMDYHLGYKKNSIEGNNSGNSRNGSRIRKLKTVHGSINLDVPRDRNSNYQSDVIKSYEENTNEVDERIIASYAKGLSTEDISDYMQDIYGIEVSSSLVSHVTNKVLVLVEEWQNRILFPIYTFLFLDGIHFKVRDNGKIVTKCAYVALGINTEGHKDILGLWIGEAESAKFWMGVLSEIKQRGVKDILIASIDGLSGFEQAIEAIYPETKIQSCIIHQVRNTLKFIPHKDKKSLAKDLKTIYTSTTEETAQKALKKVQENWPQYEIYIKQWENNWHKLSTMFEYPEEIRRVMYTTNLIENLNRQFRKVTKTKSVFPNNSSLMKLLWLRQRDITKKWNIPIRNWAQIYAQLSILFPDKIDIK